MLARRCWLVVWPSRDFAPAADLLSCTRKKVGKVLEERRSQSAPVPSPLAALGVPCDARNPRPAQNSLRSLHSLRSDSCAESAVDAGFARASGTCASRLLQRGTPKQPTPTTNSQARSPAATGLFIHPPFSAAEEHSGLQPRAQHASSTGSARLSERSVAKRVPRGVASREHRRVARCEAKGRRDQGRLFAYFLVAQKVGRPPGRTPGMGLADNPDPPRSA